MLSVGKNGKVRIYSPLETTKNVSPDNSCHGALKTGHLRAVQKRPLRGSQLKFTLFAFLIQVIVGDLPVLFSPVIHPVTSAIELDDIGMVQETVKDSAGCGVISE